MSSDRLFTPHFFVMCGFTFTVFLSAFQLLPDGAVPHPRSRRQHVRLRPLSRLSHLLVGVLGAADRGAGRPPWAASDPHHVEPGARGVLDRLRRDLRLPRDARAGDHPRHLLVGAPVGVSVVHDEPAAGEPARRGHRLLGTVDGRGDGRRADGRPVDLQARRLGLALHRRRDPQPGDGGDCVEPARATARCRRVAAVRRGRRGMAPRVARADHFVQPVSLLVRLRRDHEFHRALRRRERRDAQEHLPDRARDRHPA